MKKTFIITAEYTVSYLPYVIGYRENSLKRKKTFIANLEKNDTILLQLTNHIKKGENKIPGYNIQIHDVVITMM